MRRVVRPTEAFTSSSAEQNRKVQTPAKLLRKLLLPLLLFVAFFAWGQTIDAETEQWVINYGLSKGIPASVTRQLMIEESDRIPTAVSKLTIEGYSSRGLFQLYDRPSNIEWLLDTYWHRKYSFDIYDPRDNAEVALTYLAALHRRFGTWYLALCYYNHGDVKTIPDETDAYALRIINAR